MRVSLMFSSVVIAVLCTIVGAILFEERAYFLACFQWLLAIMNVACFLYWCHRNW